MFIEGLRAFQLAWKKDLGEERRDRIIKFTGLHLCLLGELYYCGCYLFAKRV